jgi:hypothetical protein
MIILFQLSDPMNKIKNTIKGASPRKNHFISFLKLGLLIKLIEFIKDMMTMPRIPRTRNSFMFLNNQSVNTFLKYSMVTNIKINPRKKVEINQIESCLRPVFLSTKKLKHFHHKNHW